MADEAQPTTETPAGGAAAAPAAPAAGKPFNLGMLIIVVVGLLVITATPLVTYFVMKSAVASPAAGGGEEAAPAKHGGGEAEKSGHGGGHGGGKAAEGGGKGGQILAVKSLVVNIAETKGTRVLKVEPHLQMSDPKLVEDLKGQYMAMLVDRIITAVRRKTIEDLEGTQGTESLKREIISEVNAAIKDKMAGAVTDVYFNEFLIQ